MNAAAAIASRADRVERWAAVALGFTIPISTALDKTLLAVVLVGYVMSGAWREKWQLIRSNPIALGAIALFAMLLAGALWGERNPGDALRYLEKYLDLLWIPLFLHAFQNASARSRAIYALGASLALVLLLSYSMKFGWLPRGRPFAGSPANPVVFKEYLTHNLLIAFGTFLFAQLAWLASSARARWLWTVAAVLAAINVTVMIQGRTGYLVLGLLALYAAHARFGRRGLAAAGAAMLVLIAALAAIPGPFQQRMGSALAQAREWRAGEPATTSVGLRLEFYRNSIEIVREHPLFGSGTGGFPHAYSRYVRGSGMTETRNPHNEYLHLAVQIGIVGVAALLALFCLQWRLAPRLGTPLECHLARGLVLMIAAGSLFNSLLIDHTEGLLFAWLTGLLYAGIQSNGNG